MVTYLPILEPMVPSGGIKMTNYTVMVTYLPILESMVTKNGIKMENYTVMVRAEGSEAPPYLP